MNGLPLSSFRLTVDGTEASGDPELPSLSLYQNFNYVKGVNLEAISEVNVFKGIASAEISNTMSGNVNLITKSGTNQFHGSLFENNQTAFDGLMKMLLIAVDESAVALAKRGQRVRHARRIANRARDTYRTSRRLLSRQQDRDGKRSEQHSYGAHIAPSVSAGTVVA